MQKQNLILKTATEVFNAKQSHVLEEFVAIYG